MKRRLLGVIVAVSMLCSSLTAFAGEPSEKADLSEFPDVSDVSGWAMGYIQWAVGCGMIGGKNVNGTYYLDPKGNATRVECAAMLMRFMKKYQ